jgi:hypothetical protein
MPKHRGKYLFVLCPLKVVFCLSTSVTVSFTVLILFQKIKIHIKFKYFSEADVLYFLMTCLF